MKLACRVLIAFIRFYRYIISPLFGNNCRFTPSCSLYAVEALERHGFFIGVFLTLRRICRCNPFGASGIDNVPQHFCNPFSRNCGD